MSGEFQLDLHEGLGRIGFLNAAGGTTWLLGIYEDAVSDLFGQETYLALYRDRKTLRIRFEGEEM